MVLTPIIEIRQPGRPVRRLTVDHVLEIGRSADGVELDDTGVSRRHLKLVPSPLGLSAVDLGSRNGSLLNGLPLEHRAPVKPGDVIRIGTTDILVVRRADPDRRPATPPRPRTVLTLASLPAPPAAPVVARAPGPVRVALVRLFTGAGSSTGSPAGSQPGQPTFRTFMELPRHLPRGFWHGVRLVSVVCYLALVVAMFVWPATALVAFFKLVVPLLPILFFVAPGLWRNICPLAAANQAARVFGFSRARTLPGWLQRRGYLIAIGLFLGIAGARLALFNSNASATGILLAVTIVSAFAMGVTFKGKSGWCSSICPLLPLQRVYGQTPFVLVANTHCNPCISCTRNCYDFKPQPAYQADLTDPDPAWSRPRRLFAAALPGFVLGFYTLLAAPGLTHWQVYARLALFVLGSVAIFTVLIAVLPDLEPALVAIWGAVAICVFYWYGVDVLTGGIRTLFGMDVSVLQWPVRILVIALSIIWISRTLATRGRYLADTAAAPSRTLLPLTVTKSAGARPVSGAASVGDGAAGADGAAGDGAAIRFGPGTDAAPAEIGMSVLELAERAGRQIEAGCRMGVCGADPIAVLDGAGCLTEPDEEELNTLRRLGFAANTRMACCARVQSGTVTVSLTPEPGTGAGGDRVTTFDRSIASVVVLGNGIAGVTAADFVRRGHPDCEIHLVGSESHVLYNRMGISRLVYGRSAMTGLSLLAEEWYADNQITAWLNTLATSIDTGARRVRLGTGDELYYDRLIVATGSSSAVPSLPGFGAPGTFVMRTAADAMDVRRYTQVQQARSAVVAGGGLLGLEAAFALRSLGLDVVVLERGARLMSRQLDERGSALVDAHFRRLGISVAYRAESATLQIDGRVRSVTLVDGRVVPCELFLAAVGIRPNLEIASAAGIACGKGILVDDRMQTSVPGVFAAGDVAEHGGLVLGLWPIAAKQGETAAVNALGGDQRLVAEIPATILKGVDLELSSIGQVEPGPGDEVIVLERPYSYRRLVVSRGVLVGAIVIGHHPEDLSAATAAVRKRQLLDAWALSELRAGRWEVLRAQGRVPVGAGR